MTAPTGLLDDINERLAATEEVVARLLLRIHRLAALERRITALETRTDGITSGLEAAESPFAPSVCRRCGAPREDHWSWLRRAWERLARWRRG